VETPKFPLESPNSHWKPQFFPSNYLLAMCALRSAITCSLGHVHPPFGMCALPMETPNFCLETQNSPWKTQTSPRNPKFFLGHVRPPFGMRALPWTCAPFVWHVHPPYGIRALHWACVPLVWHEACVPYVWHACALCGNCRFFIGNHRLSVENASFRIETPSSSLGMCALPVETPNFPGEPQTPWKPQIFLGNNKLRGNLEFSIGNPKFSQETRILDCKP